MGRSLVRVVETSPGAVVTQRRHSFFPDGFPKSLLRNAARSCGYPVGQFVRAEARQIAATT